MIDKKIKIEINGLIYEMDANYTILQACLKVGFDVPRYCYHTQLNIAGNCRMCLVELLYPSVNKPVVSCTYKIMENMIVTTQSMMLKKARRTIIEFLLINHPLDCPICDRAGECDLQDESFIYGSLRGRYYFSRRAVFDKFNNLFIKTIMTRCIHCTRCIRFLSEFQNTKNFLGMLGRGNSMKISSFLNNLKKIALFELSGNIIELCPVGALTSKLYAFQGKSSELNSISTIDILDSFCSKIKIEIDLKSLKILRIVPKINFEIKQDWITNKIRYCYDALSNQRILYPQINIKNYTYFKFNFLETNINQKLNNFIKFNIKNLDIFSYKYYDYYDFHNPIEMYLDFININIQYNLLNLKYNYILLCLFKKRILNKLFKKFNIHIKIKSIFYNFDFYKFEFIYFDPRDKKVQFKKGYLRELNIYTFQIVNNFIYSTNIYIMSILRFLMIVFTNYEVQFLIYYYLNLLREELVVYFGLSSTVINQILISKLIFYYLFIDLFFIISKGFILKNFFKLIKNFYYNLNYNLNYNKNFYSIKELEIAFLNINLNWVNIMLYLKSFIPQFNLCINNKVGFNFMFFLGSLINLENLLYIKNISNILGFSEIRLYNLINFFNFDLKYFTTLNIDLKLCEIIDFFCIFFFNLRLELPLLYLKIKKINNLNQNKILIFGSIYEDINIYNNVLNLGTNLKHLYIFLKGKSLYSNFFFRAKNSCFLIGSDNINYINKNFFNFELFKFFCFFDLKLYKKNIFINIVSRFVNFNNIMELSLGNSLFDHSIIFSEYTQKPNNNYYFFYMINYDDFNYYLILKQFKLINYFSSFFLYQGSNFSDYSYLADLNIPTKFIYEQKGLFIALDGKINFMKKIFIKQFNLRSDLNILFLFSSQLCITYLNFYFKNMPINILIEFEKNNFPYYIVSEIYQHLSIISPQFFYFFNYEIKLNFPTYINYKNKKFYDLYMLENLIFFFNNKYNNNFNINYMNLFNNYYISDMLTLASQNLTLASFECYKTYSNFFN